MKWMAMSLMLSLVALPVRAQSTSPSPNSEPPVDSTTTTATKIKRLMGSKCLAEIADNTNQAKNNVPCHHVVLTGPSESDNSINFHFDTEKEDAGLTYIVRSDLQKDEKGRAYYPVVGVTTHKRGKFSPVFRAKGLCSTEVRPDILAGCSAETTKGDKYLSILLK
jgi:hypothetical protein